METMINTSVYAGGITVLACALSAALTLEVRGAGARVRAAAAAKRTWIDAIGGMKRTDFAPAHNQGSLAWSPPL